MILTMSNIPAQANALQPHSQLKISINKYRRKTMSIARKPAKSTRTLTKSPPTQVSEPPLLPILGLKV